jgi:hypothetical protein
MNKIDENLRSVIIRIIDLNKQFEAGEIIFPIWQRNENWPVSYKKDLVTSILNKRMIPMLFFANIGQKNYILDGGHRTRALNSFMNNEFYIEIRRNNILVPNVYYNKLKSNNLTDEEKSIFDNYPLPLYKYTNITEDESRDIFNDLQHARSMTTAEICNSYASYLIDYLRNLENLIVNDNSLYEILNYRTNPFPKPKCHNYLLVLIQLFSFFDGDSAKSSLYSCNGGKEHISYVKKFSQDDLDDEYKKEFEEYLINFFNFISKLKLKNLLRVGDFHSIFHYMVWHDIPNINNFLNVELWNKFFEKLTEYYTTKKNITEYRKHEKEQEADELRKSITDYPLEIKQWYETHSHLKRGKQMRFSILQKFFNYTEKKTDLEEVIEPMNEIRKIT